MIAIVNYGIGNLQSIANMVKHVGGSAEITADAGRLREARAVIIPGVGSFDACVTAFRRCGFVDIIERRVREHNVPVLGICVGMQMMGRGSDEGREPGLNWIAADARKLPADKGLKVPHMGWSAVCVRPDNPLFVGSDPERRFYFVHSYHVVCDDPNDVAATADFGAPFTAAVARGGVYGVQFHPEKSHRFGVNLFQNFLKLANEADDAT